MRIAVLGPLSLDPRSVDSRSADGAPVGLGPRDRAVLAALAIHPGRIVLTDQLAEALWGDRPPASWNKVVQGCVGRLRRVLGPDAVQTHPGGYRLAVPAEAVDAWRFEAAASTSRELLARGEPDRAEQQAEDALALWRGPPLPELEDWEPGQREAARLLELRRDLEDVLLEASVREGHASRLLSRGEALVAEAPLRERRWALLAWAQYQDGRQGEALLTLQRARSMLVRELGVDPGPELARLEEAILRQEPTLIAATVLPDPVCPYPGLAPYDVQDADTFFGREHQVAECLERLEQRGVVCVVGPSGCGKSSLVRAGIAAALTRAGRLVSVATPGPDPVQTLRTVTFTSPQDVLVVDQCEEVLAPGCDPAERRRFLTALCEHHARGRLVVALRADRLGELSGHTGFARLVESGLYLLGPMGAEDLRAAIERPARQAGCRLEPGLVDVLLRETEDEPGALPLLSHALRQVWERREGRTLTLAGYRDSGGIRNAVAQTAESLYESAPQQQPLLRDLMLRLVAVSGDDEPVGTRVPRRLLAADPDQRDLLERLVTARLVTLDADTVRIAHEALVAAWPRLRAWVEDDREGQRLLRHLALAADGWDSMGRPESELYRGGRLQRVVDWRDRARPELTRTEQAFLTASLALASREEHRAAEALRRERTVNVRLRVLLVVAAVGLVAAAVTGAAALLQGERAKEAARAASAAARSATARQLGAQALLANRPDLSLLYAAHAARLNPSVVSYANLVASLMRRPQLVAYAATADPPLGVLAVRPDGRQVAILDVANRVWFYDPRSGSFQGSWTGGGDGAGEPRLVCRCAPLDYSGDGRTLAVGMLNLADPVVRFLDPATFRAKAGAALGGIPTSSVPWRGPVSQPRDIEYDGQGHRLAVSMDHFGNAMSFSYLGSSVMVWDPAAPSAPAARMSVDGRNVQVELDAANGLVYTADRDNPRRPGAVYDLARGTFRRHLPPGFGYPLALGPRGDVIAAGSGRDVLLTDAGGGPVRSLSGHRGPVNTLLFSPDGEHLASAADDHTVIVWNVRTGESEEVLDLGMRVTAGYPVGLGFSPDGAALYTVGQEGLLTWDLRGDRRFMSRVATIAHPLGWHWARGPLGYLPAPAGDLVAVSRRQGVRDSLQLLDMDRDVVRSLPETRGKPFRFVAWSPDGRQLAATTSVGMVSVWDVPSGRLHARVALGPPLNLPMEVTALAYAGRNGPLVVGSQHGTVYVVDIRRPTPGGGPARGLRQRPLASLPAAAVPLLAASPDGRTLTAFTGGPGQRSRFRTTNTGNWAVLDARTGRILHTGVAGSHVSAAAYSPDGDTLAFAADGLQLLDVRTGRIRTVAAASGARPDAEVLTLDFSPNGSGVVATHPNGSLTLWTLDAGEGQGAARVDVDAQFATFSGRHQVRFGTSSGEVFAWDVRPAHAIRFACDVVRRDLTDDELRAVGVDRQRATCPAFRDAADPTR